MTLLTSSTKSPSFHALDKAMNAPENAGTQRRRRSRDGTVVHVLDMPGRVVFSAAGSGEVSCDGLGWDVSHGVWAGGVVGGECGRSASAAVE